MKQTTIVGIDYSLTSPCVCVKDEKKIMFYYLTKKKKHLGKISDNTFVNVYKTYQDQLPLLIKCICPDIDNVIKPHKLVPVTKPAKYNFKRLSIAGGVVLVLVIIKLIVHLLLWIDV